jgi:cytochrome c biogenesis protein CcdA
MPAFPIPTFTGGKSLKKEKSNPTGNQLPTRKKPRIPYQNIIMGAAAFAYFFALQTNQVLASDMWSKAETIMKDVYGKILGISAIVTASVALLLMNFSKSGKTVDESRAWLKRIAISWVVLNGLGFILAYVTPFFSDGKWNG